MIRQDEFDRNIEQAYRIQDEMERIAGEPDINQEPTEQVHSPSWYDWFDMSVINIMQKIMTTEEYIGFLKGQSIKYRMRSGLKATIFEDIEKAKWYENKYRQFVKENTP